MPATLEVSLSLVKISALPPILNANYLRADNGSTGEIFRTTIHSYDGGVEFQSVVWDAGRYAVRLRAEAPGLSDPIEREFQVNVAVPLGTKIRTILFYIAVLIAGLATGQMAAGLKPPSRQARRAAAAITGFVLTAVLIGVPASSEAGRTGSDRPHDSGMEVKVTPEAPGAPWLAPRASSAWSTLTTVSRCYRSEPG